MSRKIVKLDRDCTDKEDSVSLDMFGLSVAHILLIVVLSQDIYAVFDCHIWNATSLVQRRGRIFSVQWRMFSFSWQPFFLNAATRISD